MRTTIKPPKGKDVFKKPLIYILLASPYQTDPRVKQEVLSLNKNGFYTYILSWDRERKYKSSSKENFCVKYVNLLTSTNFNKMVYLFSAILFQISIFLNGISLLKKNSKLIIHANDFNTSLGVCLLKIFFSNQIRIVYDCHELTPAVYSEWYGSFIGKIIGKLEMIFLNIVDEIITVSPPIIEYLNSITNHKINLIWNYPTKEIIPEIDKTKARSTLGIENDKFVIVYIGTLRSDIALLELIDAIAHIKNNYPGEYFSKIKVFIVGDGPLYAYLLKKIQNKQCYDCIKLIGRVNRDISLSYLKAADLSYILFTVKGMNTQIGMPWKLFESMVCGTQAIVVNRTYASAFIKKYNAGFTIDKIDAEDIAQAIISASNNIDNNEANVNLSEIFVWENQESSFIEIYKSLLVL